MRTTILLLALAMVSTAPRWVAAQDQRTQARAKLAEGVVLYERGDYSGALSLFREAYALFPSPRIHFNMAEAYRALARPVEAIEGYRRFLQETPDVSSQQRSDAERALVDLSRQVSTLTVVADANGARIVVDGRPVGTTPHNGAILLAAGPHQVVVEKDGRTSFLERFDAQAGTSRELHARLPLASSAASDIRPAASRLAVQSAPVASEQGSLRPWRKVGLGVAVLGAGAMVAGGIAGAQADSHERKVEEACNKTGGCTWNSELQEEQSAGHRATRLQWILLGTGAAAVAGGMSLFLLTPTPDRDGVQLTGTFGRDGAGLQLAGHW